MKKIEAIIQPHKLDEVTEALKGIGVDGVTISEVRNLDCQENRTEVYRGQEYVVELHPKMKLELLACEARLDEIVDTVSAAARSGNVFGKIGDGRICVSSIDDVILIRNGGRGENALE